MKYFTMLGWQADFLGPRVTDVLHVKVHLSSVPLPFAMQMPGDLDGVAASAPLLPVLILTIIGVLVVAGMLVLPHLIAPQRETRVKEMPYESGMDPIGDARGRYDVRFYLVALIFLVFDVELLFLYPWAVAAWHDVGLPAAERSGEIVSLSFVFAEILLFVGLLTAAYVYAWRKGVFEWR